MLETSKIQIYTELLTPPYNFETDRALCLTYSLDLTMLLSATVSLFLNKEIDGSAENERYDVLASLQDAKHKLRVHCQSGQIKVPDNYNRLYQLIEPSVRTVPMEKGSFHPKVWLIRYKSLNTENPEICYRLIVLSRNLTDSRDWDASFYSDGIYDERYEGNQNIISFIKSLPVNKEKKDNEFYKVLFDNLKKYRFDLPENIKDWKFIGMPKQRFDFPDNISRLLIISPFLRPEILKSLLKKVNSEKPYLFSRQEELDAIDNKTLSKFSCYVIKNEIIDGESLLEENSENIINNDLHAKIYIWEINKIFEGLIGSANCSNAAFHQNYESVISLKFKDSVFDTILYNLLDSNDNNIFKYGLFTPYIRHEENINKKEENKIIKEIKKNISNANYLIKIIKSNNYYDLKINITGLKDINLDYTVKLTPLSRRSDFKLLSLPETLFTGLMLDELTVFFIFEISKNDNSSKESFIIRMDIEDEEGIFNEREQALMKVIFTSMNKLLSYLAWLIEEESLSDPFIFSKSENNKKLNNSEIISYSGIPLYEKLLIIAAEHPDKLKKIDHVINTLKDQINIEKKEFDSLLSLWNGFKIFIPENKNWN